MPKRGKLSNDPDAIARRLWYEAMQLEVFKRGETDPTDELEKEMKLLAAAAATSRPGTSQATAHAEAAAKVEAKDKERSGAKDSGARKGEGNDHDEDEEAEEPDDGPGSAALWDKDYKRDGEPVLKLKSAGGYKSVALSVAEESLKKANDRDNVVDKEPDVIPFTFPENFEASRWLLRLNYLPMHAPVQAKLVCIPGIGASHLVFKKWGYHFAAIGVELWGVCLPGHSHRYFEHPMEAVNDVAMCLGEALIDMEVIRLEEGVSQTGAAGSAGSAADAAGGALTVVEDVETSPNSNTGGGAADSKHRNTRCVVFGHGLGGVIAYETVRYIQESYGVILNDLSEEDYKEAEEQPIVRDCTNLIQHLVVSAAPNPRILSRVNRDRYSTKFFCGSEEELIAKITSLGIYQRCYRTKMYTHRLLRFSLETIRSDYRLFEKYWLRGYNWVSDNRNAVGGGGGNAAKEDIHAEEDFSKWALTCPIFTMGAKDDDTVSEQDIEEWYRFTSTKHQQYLFESGKQMYMNDYSNSKIKYSEGNTLELLDLLTQIVLYGEVDLDSDNEEDENDSHGDEGSVRNVDDSNVLDDV